LFKVGVIDLPWKFNDKLPGNGRGAEKHYSCMTFDQMKNLDLPKFEDNAILFMWRVASMQAEALDLMRAYGFTLKSEIVWIKGKKNQPSIKGPEDLAFGMGHYTRAAHEVCLIGVRGKGASKVIMDHSIRSVFFAPRLRHSQKPKEFYDLVEKLTGGIGPYVDIFARAEHRPGWTFIGDEIGSPLAVKNENPSA
jgi:N6-adenosine-specific RNA methylase IME4